jgi:alkylation response protein AidB-like acyl-CoA dehydrogenase
MRFAPTDEQQMFREAIETVASRTSTPKDVRAAGALPHGERPAVLAALESTGLLGLLAPEELGGGGSELELTTALEVLGAAAAAGPVVEHAAVAVPLLAALDPAMLERVMTSGLILTATDTAIVPSAAHADGVLVLRDRAVHYLDFSDHTLESVPPAFDDSRGPARLDDEALAAASLIAEGEDVATQIALARDRAALSTAAFLVGLSTRMIEMTVDYAKIRTQFGVPIGSFQAVKHHIADAYVATAFARPAVESAAWAMSVSAGDSSRQCSMAKVLANQAARRTAKVALQCHGAIGYTLEADLHLYLTRAWSLLNAWGGTDHHRELVAASIL